MLIVSISYSYLTLMYKEQRFIKNVNGMSFDILEIILRVKPPARLIRAKYYKYYEYFRITQISKIGTLYPGILCSTIFSFSI